MTTLKETRTAQRLEVFTVVADPETGEWLGEPEATGKTTTAWDWAQKEDTDSLHFDTYVYNLETQAERALVVEWV